MSNKKESSEISLSNAFSAFEDKEVEGETEHPSNNTRGICECTVGAVV